MKKANEKTLDKIIDEMVDTVSNSKDEIYKITEESREEHQSLSEQLLDIKQEIIQLIEDTERLEHKEKLARNRLAVVSENFDKYTEDEIRDVYEKTHELQTELKMKFEREKSLRSKRDYIQRRIRVLEKMIERANDIVSKVSVVLGYLTEDFKHVGDLIEDANQKQDFGLRIIEAQEEERKRLSREIHDGPAQMLANILLRSDLVDRTFRERSREEGIKEMKSVRSMVRSSLYEVRRIIYDLRPMTLDDLGLIPTIRKYLANTEDYHNIKIEFIEKGHFDELSSKYEVALFRLIQEALQNATKHAKASQIIVLLSMTNDHITAVVKDNGIGFDTEIKKDTSFGLIGMRERVEMLDGEIHVYSTLGTGTTVHMKIPF